MMRGMVIDINDEQLDTLAQLRAFLDGTAAVDFAVAADERYDFIARTVRRFVYRHLKRADKGVVLRFLERVGEQRGQGATGSGLLLSHPPCHNPPMARPLRLELAGGLYHVTSRGDGREDIYLSDADREDWLGVFAQVCQRFNWTCHAWCQMSNHYHLLIETPEANLAKGMRQLNGVYTQRFNRTHGRTGHVFQGRYKAIMVERDSYLLELARYVVLNPLRAGMVKRLEAWPWSSYLATCGQAASPEWLQTDWLLAQFGRQRARAIRKYVEFVHEGARLPSVWTQLQSQIYLGSEAFVKTMQAQIEKKPSLAEIPRAQRRALTKILTDFEQRFDRNEAMARAYLSGQFTMAAIAEHFGVHYTTVSRLVREYENAAKP